MTLLEKKYPYMKESLWQGKLDNGLTAFLLPKPDFYETYGVLSTTYGAIHTHYQDHHGTAVVDPAGIAHFLEHKLFESKDGQDAMEAFAQLGVSSNAYTSFHQTAYLFSTTQDSLEPLQLLQTFVAEPFFTPENVEKELGIIEQEIDMYADDADYRLQLEILSSLFPGTPLAQDIAGSHESICLITAELLYEKHATFYQPENLNLFVIGRFDLDLVWKQLQVLNPKQTHSRRCVNFKPIPKLPILPHRTAQADITTPKVAVGLRGNDSIPTEYLQRYRLALHLLFGMLIGWASHRYQSFYEKGRIDSSFHFHIDISPDFHFLIIMADTKEPIQLSSLLQKAIRQFETDSDLNEQHLQILKQELYGEFIKSLNSIETIATSFTAQYATGENIFDIPRQLEELTLEEILTIGRQFIVNGDMTDFILFPK